MNEILSRALLRARLTDDDVAARLQVDPKTVRRWLEGRVPYLRHRWALALLVGVEESDLWPQLRSSPSRPSEVVSVYAHRDLVPPWTWLRLFTSARREIGVLADNGLLLADDSIILEALAKRAMTDVRVRVCLPEFTESGVSDAVAENSAITPQVARIRNALGRAEFRLHRIRGYNSLCYADRQLFVFQHVYGIPAGRAPVLQLHGDPDQEMITAYLSSFEQIWTSARPVQ